MYRRQYIVAASGTYLGVLLLVGGQVLRVGSLTELIMSALGTAAITASLAGVAISVFLGRRWYETNYLLSKQWDEMTYLLRQTFRVQAVGLSSVSAALTPLPDDVRDILKRTDSLTVALSGFTHPERAIVLLQYLEDIEQARRRSRLIIPDPDLYLRGEGASISSRLLISSYSRLGLGSTPLEVRIAERAPNNTIVVTETVCIVIVEPPVSPQAVSTLTFVFPIATEVGSSYKRVIEDLWATSRTVDNEHVQE